MKTTVLACPLLPPTTNEIIGVARRNKFASAQLKRKWEKILLPYVVQLKPIKGKFYLECEWIIRNKRRDADNVPGALKYILDSMVNTRRIEDDNLHIIQSPVIHHYTGGNFDGFILYLRDKEAFQKRLLEDLTKPPVRNNSLCSVSLPKHPTKSRSGKKKNNR